MMRDGGGAARRPSVATGSRVPDPARKPALLEVCTNLKQGGLPCMIWNPRSCRNRRASRRTAVLAHPLPSNVLSFIRIVLIVVCIVAPARVCRHRSLSTTSSSRLGLSAALSLLLLLVVVVLLLAPSSSARCPPSPSLIIALFFRADKFVRALVLVLLFNICS